MGTAGNAAVRSVSGYFRRAPSRRSEPAPPWRLGGSSFRSLPAAALLKCPPCRGECRSQPGRSLPLTCAAFADGAAGPQSRSTLRESLAGLGAAAAGFVGATFCVRSGVPARASVGCLSVSLASVGCLVRDLGPRLPPRACGLASAGVEPQGPGGDRDADVGDDLGDRRQAVALGLHCADGAHELLDGLRLGELLRLMLGESVERAVCLFDQIDSKFWFRRHLPSCSLHSRPGRRMPIQLEHRDRVCKRRRSGPGAKRRAR